MKEHLNILVLSRRGHKKHLETLASRSRGQVRPGQKVQRDGHPDLYVVLRVDRERLVAELLHLDAIRKVISGIPLSSLKVVEEPGVNELGVSA